MPSVHEVFAHAPLALVTAQVNFPYEPRLNDIEARDRFATLMRQEFPVLSNETVNGVTIDPTGQAEMTTPLQQIRASNLAGTVSVVLNSQSMTIEVTAYEHFNSFSALLRQCFEAVSATVPGVLVIRTGLRYIDEIRVPGIEGTGDWSGWLDDALLAPTDFMLEDGGSPAGINGLATFEIEGRSNMIFRWAELIGTTIIAPSAGLRRDTPPHGRFFILDADVFWQPELPTTFDVDDLIARFRDLHSPASAVFARSLTPRTRSFFRGEPIDD